MSSENSIPQALVHVLLVSFPGQGHVNPILRLGKRLASKGLLVTFSAPELAGSVMREANSITSDPKPVGDGYIRFEFFDDEWKNGMPYGDDLLVYMDQLELLGKAKLISMVARYRDEGRPVSCLINNPFVPWVSDLAETLGIPGAVLWVQSCASFSAYYHYHQGLDVFPTDENPKADVALPSMPTLKWDEIPSFLHPSNAEFSNLKTVILSQFKNLSKPFCVLMDTFEELEPDIVSYFSKTLPIKTVGPLYKDPNQDTSKIRGDFVKSTEDCIGWLDSRPNSSVAYVSFGTVALLGQEQEDEILNGLMESGVPFLWVTKRAQSVEFSSKGKIVRWAPQEEVLAHPAVGLFMTHCGWNSTLEALGQGVPVIAFPQWGDQVTDAKFLVDVFKVGLRMSRGAAENRIVPRDEVKKCLIEALEGVKAMEMKENALKWKAKADSAAQTGGSSDKNLRDFIDDIKKLRAK